MSRNRLILCAVAAPILLSGCADYLNHYDTVTLTAGDAQGYNRLLHAKDPFNPHSRDTAIPTDGKRAADAVTLYRNSLEQAAPGAQPQAVINITNN